AACLYYAVLRQPPKEGISRLEDPGPSLEAQVAKGSFRTSFLRAIDHGQQVRLAARPQTINAWRPELLRGSRLVRGSRLARVRRQIFISYRRADTLAISGHVYDQLRQAFDADRVFFDVDTIPAGVDFRDHIAECMDLTAVCVAVVGHRWRRRPIATRLL